MRIAIIGSGISGLVAAYKLHQKHEVTVFEANDYIGGHTNTVEVDVDGQNYAIDTGFIVFNDRTYPNFCQLMDDLHDRRP
jgi:predicted NAD/FAD-binding protein